MPVLPRSKTLVPDLIVASVLMFVFAVSGAQEAEQPRSNDKIKQLLKERLETVTTIYELKQARYKLGEMSFNQVLEAHASVLTAKLDLCETKNDRIKVHEEMIKVATDILDGAKKLVLAHETTQIEVLEAQAQLLEVRIGLENAKAAN